MQMSTLGYLTSVNQQTHAEPTTTTLSTSISTSTPTPSEMRPDEPTTTELVLTEDKSETAWRKSLKRSIEALELDLNKATGSSRY